MKREVERADFKPYAVRPTWTLHLSCGHDATYSAREATSKPPRDFDCVQCDEVAQRSESETTNEERNSMSAKVKAKVGMQAIFKAKHHVCVALPEGQSVWWPADAKTVKHDGGPFGLRLVAGEEVVERREVAEVLTRDVQSHEPFKQLTEKRVGQIFSAFAVSEEEAKEIGEQQEKERNMKTQNKATKAHQAHTPSKPHNGEGGTEEPTPAAQLRALGKAGVGRQHGRAIAAVLWPTMKPYLPMDYIWEGQNGKGTIAELTKKRIEELKAVAPDPKAAKAEAGK